jgi:hypothetical protein
LWVKPYNDSKIETIKWGRWGDEERRGRGREGREILSTVRSSRHANNAALGRSREACRAYESYPVNLYKSFLSIIHVHMHLQTHAVMHAR